MIKCILNFCLCSQEVDQPDSGEPSQVVLLQESNRDLKSKLDEVRERHLNVFLGFIVPLFVFLHLLQLASANLQWERYNKERDDVITTKEAEVRRLSDELVKLRLTLNSGLSEADQKKVRVFETIV